MYTSVFLESAYTSNVNSDFEAASITLYGPYRCHCTAETTCPACVPEKHRDHATTPPTVPCAVCRTPMRLNISQRGALTKGQRLFCGNACRRAAERAAHAPPARQLLERQGVTALDCGYCGRTHPLAAIDNRRLGRYALLGHFYCPGTPCARSAKKH